MEQKFNIDFKIEYDNEIIENEIQKHFVDMLEDHDCHYDSDDDTFYEPASEFVYDFLEDYTLTLLKEQHGLAIATAILLLKEQNRIFDDQIYSTLVDVAIYYLRKFLTKEKGEK